MFKITTIKVKGSADNYVTAFLKNNGFERKSSGSFASVYTKLFARTVYKVGQLYRNKPYMAYIQTLSEQQKQNPFAPRIKSVDIYVSYDSFGEDERDAMFVVCMERLNEIEEKYKPAQRWLAERIKARDHDTEAASKILGFEIIDTTPPEINEIVSILRTAKDLPHSGYPSWDLHSGNFMLRGKQLVITDPLS